MVIQKSNGVSFQSVIYALMLCAAFGACATMQAENAKENKPGIVPTTATVLVNVSHFSNNLSLLDGFEYADGGHKLARDANGVLHTVFSDIVISSNMAGNYQIVYARSVDNGATWTSHAVDTLASGSGAWEGSLNDPSIAVYGSQVYITYLEATGNVLANNGVRMITFADNVDIPNILSNSNKYWVKKATESLRYTDIAIDNAGYIYVAFVDNTNATLRLFKSNAVAGAISADEDFTEQNSGGFAVTNKYAMTPHLAIDAANNIALSFDAVSLDISLDYTRAGSSIALYKKTSGTWSSATTITGTYAAMHSNIAFDVSGNLHVVYSDLASAGGNMNLCYKVYNAAGTDITTSKTNPFPTISNKEIYTPQIGFTTANIPVIQYVKGDVNGWGDNVIMQISQKSNTTWSVPAAISSGNVLFVHMVSAINNDQPNIIWYSPSYLQVYAKHVEDKVAPWQPPVLSLTEIAAGLPAGNILVSASIGTTMPTRSYTAYYKWGYNGAEHLTTWTFSTSDAKIVNDNQTVTVQVKVQDTALNESEWSGIASFIASDRSAPQ